MKTLQAGLGMFLGGLVVLSLGAAGASRARHAGGEPRAFAAGERAVGVVVGTFDSRAVAVAYLRSQATKDYLRAQHADLERLLERAREAGDRLLVDRLDALGPALQDHRHQQGFGTAPVDDILARIGERLPEIAREAGVDLIVSKWTLAYRDPAAPLVDVTERLVAEFQPDEETLKGIRQLVLTEPVPLEQLETHH